MTSPIEKPQINTAGLHWRTHTERPAAPTTALIAIPLMNHPEDDGGPVLMTELHIYSPSEQMWSSERGGMPIRHAVFWWLPERDVLKGLVTR